MVRRCKALIAVAVMPFLITSCLSDNKEIEGIIGNGGGGGGGGGTYNLTLSPLADTSLNLNTTNNSAWTELTLYTWPNYSIANNILMKFDVSAIPSGATVTSATLKLYQIDSGWTPAPHPGDPCINNDADHTVYTVRLYAVEDFDPVVSLAEGATYDGTNPWDPNACCFGGYPLGMSNISIPYDTVVLGKSFDYKDFDSTQLVQDWVDGATPNYGLMIDSDPAKYRDCRRSFASSEHADPNTHPKLEVTYTTN